MTDGPDKDVRAFIDALRSVRCTAEGPYKPGDRYRDFHTSLGTEEGKRVLAQIIDFAEGSPISIHDVSDHAKLAYRAGMRAVGMKIAAWASVPPREETIIKGTPQ